MITHIFWEAFIFLLWQYWIVMSSDSQKPDKGDRSKESFISCRFWLICTHIFWTAVLSKLRKKHLKIWWCNICWFNENERFSWKCMELIDVFQGDIYPFSKIGFLYNLNKINEKKMHSQVTNIKLLCSLQVRLQLLLFFAWPWWMQVSKTTLRL